MDWRAGLHWQGKYCHYRCGRRFPSAQLSGISVGAQMFAQPGLLQPVQGFLSHTLPLILALDHHRLKEVAGALY